MNTRKQLTVFAILIVVNAILAVISYLLLPLEQLAMPGAASMGDEFSDMPRWLLGAANGGIVLVMYGLLGLLGFWLARRVGLPGIYREDAGAKNLFWIPLLLGVVTGAFLVIVDSIFTRLRGSGEGIPHPEFPLSIIASATAGIGEEVLFRLFLLSLWAVLLVGVLRRFGLSNAALWIANGIAALAFAAGHLPAAMLITGAATPAGIPPLLLVELVLLNGAIGLAAGQRFIKDGLVAASGVHFWADIVWHVFWPLL